MLRKPNSTPSSSVTPKSKPGCPASLPRPNLETARELSDLGEVVETIKTYRATASELRGIEALIEDPKTNSEMREFADIERRELRDRLEGLEKQIQLDLLPKDAMDNRNVIVEIRAGTGGDEAALFAGDLFRMYERYAANQGWKVEVVSASEGTSAATRKSSPRSRAAARSPS